MEDLYIRQHLASVPLSIKYGVGDSTVRSWLKEYGIPIKTRKQTKKRANSYAFSELRKELVDEILRESGKNIEEITTSDFRKKGLIGVIQWYQRKYNCSSLDACNHLVEDLYGITIDNQDNSKRLENLLQRYIGEENERI